MEELKYKLKLCLKISFLIFILRMKRFVFLAFLVNTLIILNAIYFHYAIGIALTLVISSLFIIDYFLKLIRLLISYLYYEKMVSISIYIQQNKFKFLIFVFGQIRSGKDLFMTCFSRTQSRIYQSEIMQKLDNIRDKLYYIDFNIVHGLINYYFQYTQDFSYITYSLIVDLKLNTKVYYYDYIKIDYLIEMLKEYTELYYYLYLRDSYIIANMPIEEVSGFYSKILDFNDLRLRTHKTFKIQKYNIVCITEFSNQYPSHNFDTSSKKEKNEQGEELTLTTWGHLFKEKSKLISTTQRVDAGGKILRVVFTDNCRINGFEKKSIFRYELNALSKKIEKLKRKMLKKTKKRELKNKLSQKKILGKFFKYKLNNYSLEQNKERLKTYKKLCVFDFLFQHSYLKFDIDNYAKQEDLEKANPESKVSYKMYYKLLDGFGKYNTHIFNIIARYKYWTSTEDYNDLEEFESLELNKEQFAKTNSKVFNDFIKE